MGNNYKKSEKEILKNTLSNIQYKVTQENATERPFENEFWDYENDGLYVDIVSGEPLFTSKDKFNLGCGWPSFSKPVQDDTIKEKIDSTLGMKRVEVRSANADSHLGHVFTDGPRESGGLRYCINSASLRFIPFDDLEKEGYGQWVKIFNNTKK